jgi:hypothetical protein
MFYILSLSVNVLYIKKGTLRGRLHNSLQTLPRERPLAPLRNVPNLSA